MAIGVLEIDVAGAATQQNLRMALEAVQPASLAFFLNQTAHQIILRRLSERFERGGDDASGRWLALGEATRSFRENQGFAPSSPINIRTGELRNWLMENEPDVAYFGPGAQYTFPGEGVGSNSWLQVKLETAQRGKNFPATEPRPVLAMNMNDMALVTAALGEYIALRMRIGF